MKPEEPTAAQLRTLLSAMEQGEEPSTFEATVKYHITNLPKRICDLLDLGWPIDSYWCTSNEGKRFKRYYLIKDEPIAYG